MTNKISLLIIAVILFINVLGCSFIRQVSEVMDKSSEPNTVVSTDNKIQLSVPATWSTTLKLQEDATIQVGQPLRELYVVVIPDDKKDFEQSADLDFITDLIRKNTGSLVTNVEFSEPVSVKIGGYNAKQFEAGGSIDKINIKYIFTIVDTPDYYYQIVAWTLKSKFEGNKENLKQVVNSFKLANKIDISPQEQTK